MDEVLKAVLLVGLATAALARLISNERGLWAVFERFRNKFPESSEAGKIVRCPLCLGVYVSTVLTLYVILALVFFPVGLWLLVIPAALGLAYAMIGLSNLWG